MDLGSRDHGGDLGGPEASWKIPPNVCVHVCVRYIAEILTYSDLFHRTLHSSSGYGKCILIILTCFSCLNEMQTKAEADESHSNTENTNISPATPLRINIWNSYRSHRVLRDALSV